MVYESYATKADIASFTGKSVDSLPANINALIQKASDLITNHILVQIDMDNEDHVESLNKATCSQVEYWLETGDQDQNERPIQSYSAGSVSVTYADNGGVKKTLCNAARGYLNKQGLLYRGGRLI